MFKSSELIRKIRLKDIFEKNKRIKLCNGLRK